MNTKRTTTLLSTFAIIAIAACANTASAHGVGGHESNRNKNYEHTLFHQQEAARREVQDGERKERAERRLARFERERRQYVRDYGIRSAEYRWFITRWERRWADAVTRERRLMIEQRQAARRRHEQYHMNADQFAYLSLADDCIERDMFSSGVQPFPYDSNGRPVYGRSYGDDNRPRPFVSQKIGPRDLRRENEVDVDWNLGVHVHN